MIIKNKSFYEKFVELTVEDMPIVDWGNNFKKDKPLITGSANEMIYSISLLLFVLLAAFYDPLWRPFLHYYFPDSIPLLDYQPYTP